MRRVRIEENLRLIPRKPIIDKIPITVQILVTRHIHGLHQIPVRRLHGVRATVIDHIITILGTQPEGQCAVADAHAGAAGVGKQRQLVVRGSVKTEVGSHGIEEVPSVPEGVGVVAGDGFEFVFGDGEGENGFVLLAGFDELGGGGPGLGDFYGLRGFDAGRVEGFETFGEEGPGAEMDVDVFEVSVEGPVPGVFAEQ